jgi:hypothetical protein
MRRFALPFALLLGACVPVTPSEVPTRNISPEAISSLPPMKTFAPARPAAVRKSNNDIAIDFIELSFQLESGRDLPTFTRFEGPITVRVTGAPPPSLSGDLSRLLNRLRREAGIEISQVGSSDAANITIQAVSRSDIRKALPHAACFVVPNISNLAEYRAARRTPRTNWSGLKTRQKLAIFLTNDSSPQAIRIKRHAAFSFIK